MPYKSTLDPDLDFCMAAWFKNVSQMHSRNRVMICDGAER